MVDHTIVGQRTGCGQPTHGREHSIGAMVGQPTSTDSAMMGQPISTNDYETKFPVTDPDRGILHDGDQIIINFPLVGFQTKKQTALEAFAATMTVDFEVYAERRRVNFTQWDSVIAAVIFRKKNIKERKCYKKRKCYTERIGMITDIVRWRIFQ